MKDNFHGFAHYAPGFVYERYSLYPEGYDHGSDYSERGQKELWFSHVQRGYLDEYWNWKNHLFQRNR